MSVILFIIRILLLNIISFMIRILFMDIAAMMRSITEKAKEQICRFFLDRYFKNIFKGNLMFDQLVLKPSSGTAALKDLVLNVDTLNEKLDGFNLPFIIVNGKLNKVDVTAPWKNVFTENSFIEVEGLTLTIQPKQRSSNASAMDSIVDSMMTTSIQMARDCMANDKEKDQEPGRIDEGLEIIAKAIESVLKRIKARLKQTVVRLEYAPKEKGKTGIALQINIDRIDYCDEGGIGKGAVDEDKLGAFSCKLFMIGEVSVCAGEFYSYTSDELKSSCFSDSQAKSTDHYATAPETPEPNLQSSIGADMFSEEKIESSNFGHHTSLSDLATNSDGILISKLTGPHTIRVKLKQCDTVSGFKVSVEFNWNSIVMFLSPCQLFLIKELLSHFISPAAESDDQSSHHSTSKPMKNDDYVKLQKELDQQTKIGSDHSLANLNIWSSQQLEESNETFFPVYGPNHTQSNSFLSTSSVSVDSCSSSCAIDNKSSRSSVSNGNDAVNELVELKIQLGCFAIILLHEDVLIPAANLNGMMVHSSVVTMKSQAESFFKELGEMATSVQNLRYLSDLHAQLSSVCRVNHLRFIGTPCSFEYANKGSFNMESFSANVLFGNADLVECLFKDVPASSQVSEPIYYHLLKFNDDIKLMSESISNFYSAVMAQPAFKMHFKCRKSLHTSGRRQSCNTRTEFDFQLASCILEVDISILDRITSLLYPSETFVKPATSTTNEHGFDNNVNHVFADNAGETDLNVKLSSPSLTIKLRFPIPDLRDNADMNRASWWNRTIRKDSLLLDLVDARLRTSIHSDSTCDLVEIRCRELFGSFQENDEDPAIQFLWAYAGNDCDSLSPNEMGWPRLCLQIREPIAQSVLEDHSNHEDVSYTAVHGSIETVVQELCNSDKDNDPSPFVTRKIVYRSSKFENSDRGASGKEEGPEEDQLILPGDRKDADNFMEWANSNTRYILDVNVENLKLFLPSKHFFEVLYNRLTVDLLLWKPLANNPTVSKESSNFHSSPATLNWLNGIERDNGYRAHMFLPCMPASQFESSSDSEENGPTFDSYKDYKEKKKTFESKTSTNHIQNTLSLTVNSKHTCIELNLPLRDSARQVVPEYEGRLHILAEDCQLSMLSAPNESPVGTYMCLHANSAVAYHKGCVSASTFDFFTSENNQKEENLILHVTKDTAKVKNATDIGIGGDSADVISLVIHTTEDEERNMKTLCIAFGLRGATYHYLMMPGPEFWYNQVVDFFNVEDYQIMGYTAPKIITEMHIHAWECAIDYRPLYIPLRVMLTMDSFSMNSNVTTQTNSSIVKIILEDANLFLSKNFTTLNTNLKKDYVCVMDMGLFELVILSSDGKDSEIPNIDVQIGNNQLNIRTCVDSFTAIQELLQYIASDGDLRVEPDFPDEDPLNGSFNTLTMECNDDDGIGLLMEEAMKESLCSSAAECGASLHEHKLASDVFLFPGESDGLPVSAIYPHLENEITSRNSDSDSDSDDSYCILDKIPGVGILPAMSNEPVITVLSSEPIRIIDNHFTQPTGRTDQLKAPKQFPPAVIRYTLREITVVWRIYGGHDFPFQNSTIDKKLNKVRLRNSSSGSDGSDSLEILTTKHGQDCYWEPKGCDISFNKNKNEVTWKSGSPTSTIPRVSANVGTNVTNWITKGGQGRQNNTVVEFQANKISFRHETYPDSFSCASRQILLVQDFVIYDRLASSNIGKFLYQYSSENMPRQSHSNMLTVRAVHRRQDNECGLKVSMLPLRLNIDQDTIMFLVEFFGSLSSSRDFDDEMERSSTRQSKPYQAPVFSVGTCGLNNSKTDCGSNEKISESQKHLIDFDEIEAKMMNNFGQMSQSTRSGSADSTSTNSNLINSSLYFSSFEFTHDVLIRFDYQGKLDLGQRALPAFLMGVVDLNGSELHLKKIGRVGIKGDKLLQVVINEWLEDIMRNQLPNILCGVGPLRTVKQFLSGCHSLVMLPIEQYRKDGRIVRGLQRGASAFTTSTTMAVLELTNRFVDVLQTTAEFAYDVVTPGPSAKEMRVRKATGAVRKPHHPADLAEGVTNALHVVTEGLSDTAKTLFRVASQEHEQKGISGAVGGVLRQIPSTVVKPIILATEATSNVLGGMKHQLAPDMRKEAAEKWRDDDYGQDDDD